MLRIDCQWGIWTEWEGCSATCGGGTQDRSRNINLPAENGGSECTGDEKETQTCNTDGCPGKY